MDWSFLIKNKESLNVTTDSRKITPGCIFVALKGEHFDGNDFVDQAKADGAAYIISGENALKDLQDLARAWRRHLDKPIIAITGTNGKTTTKELTAAVLKTKFNVHYTQGNLNNSLGVPLTVLQLTTAHPIGIIEMGASHPGDIKELVEVAEPNFGLITNVGRAHLQGFGSFEGVMHTKAELYDWLIEHNGNIFRNADNPYLEKMLEDARANSQWPMTNCHCYTTGKMPEGTHLVGDYNSENVQAALCVGEYFGISREQGLSAIKEYIPTNNRSQRMQTERNTLIIDAYNANPTSMQAAINAFTGDTYILGKMGELGDYSHTEHQNIVNMLLERKAPEVYLVGTEWQQTTAPYPIFPDREALITFLKEKPLSNKHILIKGSRGNKLEEIIPLL